MKCPICNIEIQSSEYFVYHFYFTHKEAHEDDDV
jgi:hypothetical protein